MDYKGKKFLQYDKQLLLPAVTATGCQPKGELLVM